MYNQKSSKVYLRKPRIMAVKKFRRIKFEDSKQWKILHPQNKTLLFAQDINGYWCKEHQKGMSRIQAVISHYSHKHNGAEIIDSIEFQDAIISDKSGKALPTKKQKEKMDRIMTSKIFDRLTPKDLPPDWVRNSKGIVAVKNENLFKKEEWWKEDPEKVRKEINEVISKYELFKKAKNAGLPKSELDRIKIKLGIQSEDTDEEIEKKLLELSIRKLAGQ